MIINFYFSFLQFYVSLYLSFIHFLQLYIHIIFEQVRFVTYGQNSNRADAVKSGKHGYLLRKSTPSGRKILARRIAKGRSTLSH